MDKPIAVGDLVMVVRPEACCGTDKSSGRVYVVKKLVRATYPRSCCTNCGAFSDQDIAYADTYGGYSVSRLKRIPPLSELDSIKTQEEITA